MMLNVRKNHCICFAALILIVCFFMASAVFASQAKNTLNEKVKVSSSGININTATADELTALPGVGIKLAERIVRYRDEVGKFKSPSDLISVKGVGQKKLNKMLKLIVVK